MRLKKGDYTPLLALLSTYQHIGSEIDNLLIEILQICIKEGNNPRASLVWLMVGRDNRLFADSGKVIRGLWVSSGFR